jgi:hypothetical protein
VAGSFKYDNEFRVPQRRGDFWLEGRLSDSQDEICLKELVGLRQRLLKIIQSFLL